VDWIDVAQDRDMWRAFVNAMVNLSVSRLIEETLTSKVEFCLM